MRVALISSLYHPHFVGGAERSAQRIAEGLARLGHDVLVVTMGKATDVPCERLNGVTVVRVRLANIYWPFPVRRRPAWQKFLWHAFDSYNIISARRVLKAVRRFDPDIVQTHNLVGFSTMTWCLLATLRRPIVHVLHDYYALCIRSTMVHNGNCFSGPHAPCRYVRWLQLIHSRKVSAVVGVSRFVLQANLKASLFPLAKLRRVFMNGYELPPGVVATVDKPPSSPLHVGFIGQLAPVKGLETLLSAVSLLPGGSVVVSIAGSGDKEFVDSLKSRFPLKNVNYLGRVSASPFLSSLDVLCVPSVWHDPLPTVVFEAYKHAVPVFASDIGGITEMIEDCITGKLFPAGDHEALAKILGNYVDKPWLLKPMREAANRKGAEFSVEANIISYDALHRELAGPGKDISRQ